MPRSRSRERRRDRERDRSHDRERRSHSRSRDRDRKLSRSRSRDRRRSRDRDYKRRDRSSERYRRDKYESSKHRSKDRDRSQERHRDRSRDRHKRRDSRDRRRDRSSSRSRKRRSESSERKSSQCSSVQSGPIKPIVIKAVETSKKSKSKNTQNASMDHRESFEISNEFSKEGFEQFSRDHGIDFTKIETDEDREAVHEKMEELLKAHFAAQGKVYPPPKPEKPTINAATGFANDGSFLEQFKKMQEEYKLQQTSEQKRQSIEENLKNLPIRKRRGGKILKTGIVAKTKVVSEASSMPSDAWDLYKKEVQKYKNASSCDSESKTRPLVK